MPNPIVAPLKKFVSYPVHMERDADYLWRLKGHFDQIVLAAPGYRAATKSDMLDDGGEPGMPTVRKFPFAYNTPGILTGAPLYTPTIGDVLLDAWVAISTLWNGNSPILSIGEFVNGLGSGWGDGPGAAPFQLNLSSLTDVDIAKSEFSEQSLFVPQGISLQTGQKLFADTPGAGVSRPLFTAANPIKVVVSQSGNAPQAAYAGSSGSATIPTTVVTGTNDQFTFNGNVYTVAPGTYSTYQALVNAMLAATHSGTPLSSLMRMVTDASGDLDAAALVTGTALNGAAFGTGTHDFLAASGWHNGDSFANGTVNGGDPGSTQGAATLYLVTATPV
jgi:hypothetical protein